MLANSGKDVRNSLAMPKLSTQSKNHNHSNNATPGNVVMVHSLLNKTQDRTTSALSNTTHKPLSMHKSVNVSGVTAIIKIMMKFQTSKMV